MPDDQQTASVETKLPDYVIGHEDRVALNCPNCDNPVRIDDPIKKSVREQEVVCNGCGKVYAIDIHLCACLVPKANSMSQQSSGPDLKT